MSEKRLRELLDAAAPHFDPLEIDPASRRHSRPLLAVAAAAVVVALVALTAALIKNGGRGATPAAADSSTDSTADLAELTARIPCDMPKDERVAPAQLDDLHPVALFFCTRDTRTYADGVWTVSIRKAAEPDDMASIIRTLQAPIPPASSGPVSCPRIGYVSVGVAFVASDGNYLVPDDRRDLCSVPVGLHAFDSVTFQELSVTKVSLQKTPTEIATNCEPRFKGPSILGIDSLDPAPATADVFADAPNAVLRACVFGPGEDAYTGDFVRGVTLDASQSDRLRGALSGAGTSDTCAAQQDFAVVFAGGQFAEVELGGCYRVLRPDYSVGTADRALVTELLE